MKMKTTILYLMIERTLIVIALVATLTSVALAQSSGKFRKMENNAFTVGEELYFDVKYGFVTAGEAKFLIPRYLYMNGRKCYNVEFYVKSKPFFDSFYKVRDRYETNIDVEGLFPWKFVQQVREGGYSFDFSAWFDNERNRAITAKGSYPMPPYTQDIVSAFYFMRTYDYSNFQMGQTVSLRNFYKDSTYVLTIKYHGKETVEVGAGTFRTIILEPIMKEGGLFKTTGRLLVWLTDDERKVPVLVKAEIPIGSIKSELTFYKGLAGPLKAKIK